MPVPCSACGTANRDNAMFCRGCLGKLAAFAPTAPSMLETLRNAPVVTPAVQDRAAKLPVPRPRTGVAASWLGLGVLAMVGVLGVVVWGATSARVPHPGAAPVAATAQVAALSPRAQGTDPVEVLGAAHRPVPVPMPVPEPEALSPSSAREAPVPGSLDERSSMQPRGQGAALKAKPERAASVAKAKPRKDRRTPVVASMSGARAACDRYNPYGEVLCTQGGYPYATWSRRGSGRR